MVRDMTLTSSPTAPADLTRPPYSRLVQTASGVLLIMAGLLNGLPQYLMSALAFDGSFAAQIAWGATHPAHRVEQTVLVVSLLCLPLGLLGLAQVTRWRAPRLTLVAAPLVLWGTWGFHNVISMGFVPSAVVPAALSVEDAVTVNDALATDPAVLATALVPHLVRLLLGVALLTLAAWRSGVFFADRLRGGAGLPGLGLLPALPGRAGTASPPGRRVGVAGDPARPAAGGRLASVVTSSRSATTATAARSY